MVKGWLCPSHKENFSKNKMRGKIFLLGSGPPKLFNVNPVDGCDVVMGQLCAVSRDDLDIVKAHEKIASYLEYMTFATIPILRERLIELTGGSDLSYLQPSVAVDPSVKKEIETLSCQIQDLNQNIMKSGFLADTSCLVEAFKKLPPPQEQTERQKEVKRQCVNTFLSQASKYIKIDLMETRGKEKHDMDVSDSFLFSETPTYDSGNARSKNKDSSHGKNFWAYKAEFTCSVPLGVDYTYLASLLDNYFYSRGMYTGAIIKSMPFNKDGISKGPYTIKELELALQFLGLSKLYSKLVIIAVSYWGWVPPNISIYDERINRKQPLLDTLYNKYKKNYGKKSSPNCKLSLYILLTMMGYPHCKLYMYDLITSETTVKKYNSIFKQIAEEAVKVDPTWVYIPIPEDGVIREYNTKPSLSGRKLIL